MTRRASAGLSPKIRQLMAKGVIFPVPLAVDVAQEVDTERISGNDVIIYPGSKIYGEKTLVSMGARLGYEGPATVADCRIGPGVELKGGFFKSSVFLEKSSVASGAMVREGCLLEEQASAGHTVGLKQTILFPFVTLGSLINFCDCLMAGGTSRTDHSEVGSSYIHFNFTPHQDKATPSLIGDVPRGVMLNQPPIFLGGQGGLVGPARIGYGTVIAAGTVWRRDVPEGGKLCIEKDGADDERIFHMGFYGSIDRRVRNNISYIANLLGLRQWYAHVRQPFFLLQEMGKEMYLGAMETLEVMIGERLKRLQYLSQKMEKSLDLGEKSVHGHREETLLQQKKEFLKNWSKIEACFTAGDEMEIDQMGRHAFIEMIHRTIDKGNKEYLQGIRHLGKQESAAGTAWLQNIVDHIVTSAMNHLPSFSG